MSEWDSDLYPDCGFPGTNDRSEQVDEAKDMGMKHRHWDSFIECIRHGAVDYKFYNGLGEEI